MALIYFILFVLTIILGYLFGLNDIYVKKEIIYVVIINIILFNILIKVSNVKARSVTKFLLIILGLFSVLIIDKGYFLSYYKQSTPEEIFPFSYLSFPINIILLPFVGVFDFLYSTGLYDLAFIIIPFFIMIIILISRKIVND